jgi:hypothetical protein
MAVYLVWGLQTSFDNKLTVTLSFASRLPYVPYKKNHRTLYGESTDRIYSLIITIGFRLSTFSSVGLTTNPTFLQAEFIVWTQTELCYSIIAATIPSIRPLMRVLATNYGANVAEGTESSGVRSRTNYSAYLGSSNDIELPTLRPKGKGDDYNYRVWVPKTLKIQSTGDGGSLTSNDSQKMIIKQDVEWEVNVK